MRALILERNKKVARRLVRYLTSAGFEATAVAAPEDVADNLDRVCLLAADSFDGDLVAQQIVARPHLRGLLWTAEPLQRSLGYALDTPQISNICGRADFESAPQSRELIMAARRIRRQDVGSPGLAGFLDWGFTGFEARVGTSEQRDLAVTRVQAFVGRVGAPRRIGELFGELAHEMLMNAMFSAPVDDRGQPLYAMDRKARIALPERDRPMLRVACDGTRLALQVTDRFGRLERHHVFAGLARGLAGELDTSGGGAGMGMVVCHNATVAMFFDVVWGRATEVTGIYDLDLNQREFRTRARSLHFFARDARTEGGAAQSSPAHRTSAGRPSAVSSNDERR